LCDDAQHGLTEPAQADRSSGSPVIGLPA